MNTTLSTAQRAAQSHQLAAAQRKADVSLLERLLSSADSAVLSGAGDIAMAERRWIDAAALLDRVIHHDPTAKLKLYLTRNLASMQQHRPLIYNELMSLPKSDHCGIGASATEHPTIIVRHPSGTNIALSAGNRPMDALASAVKQLKPAMNSGVPLALCGIGDGYLLQELAAQPPTLYLNSQQFIVVVEPDAHVVLTALMLHDYSGPTGPIEQARFAWIVGSDWAHGLRNLLLDDPYLPSPSLCLSLGLHARDIQAALHRIGLDFSSRDEQVRQSVDTYYDSLNAAQFQSLLGEKPTRRPRVLLMTTRFSTVLQFATRDAANGFEQAGWETRVLIEPTPHHRILNTTIRDALARFKPDLVFQIDRQRQEHGNLLPANLPFVSWFQDHMQQLMTREAGDKITPSDFILTDAGPIYVKNYGYPQRQMIAVSKLTSLPPVLPRSATRANDIIFVTNATHTPTVLIEKLFAILPWTREYGSLVNECISRLIDLHDADDCLAAYRDVREFLRDLLTELRVDLSEEHFGQLAWQLNHPVCDALYRQQAARWMVDTADDMGLKLSLYGAGWDQHEKFAPYARGMLGTGPEMNERCRQAAINFQVAPYLCLHQRLLDGISVGGFFLIRENVNDLAPQEMLDLLETHCGSDVSTTVAARAVVPPPVRDRFERLLKDCARGLAPVGDEDPIEVVRVWQEAGLLVPAAGVLPHLKLVSFKDPGELKERIIRFVNDPTLRDRIVTDQRQSIAERLTYSAAMKRVATRIGTLLRETPGQGRLASINRAKARAA